MTNNVKAFLTDVNRDGFHEVAEAILANGGKDAEHISYDNTESGLAGDNVQAAIDEVAGDVGDLVTAVNDISGDVDDLETAVGGISDDVSDLQTAVSGKVSKSGDTMTGKLTIEDNLDVTGDINTQLVSTIGMQFVNALGGNIILTGHPTAAGSSTVEVRDQNGIMALTSDVAEKVSKSGDTMTGGLDINVPGEAFIKATNTSANKGIEFGVSSSGNRGIYDINADRWLFRYDNNDILVNNTKVPYNGGTLATQNDITLKSAANWTEALTNAKEYIIFVGKGTNEKNIQVCISMYIPVLALENTQKYWMIADTYAAGGTQTYTHLQVYLSKTEASSIGLYYGNPAVLVSDATYEIYYR